MLLTVVTIPLEFFQCPVDIPTNVEYPTGFAKNSCAIISYPSADVKPRVAVCAVVNPNCSYPFSLPNSPTSGVGTSKFMNLVPSVSFVVP